MKCFPFFLSIIIEVYNQGKNIRENLIEIESIISNIVSDYEIIIINNASTDNSLSVLKDLTGKDGLSNLQVYSLTKKVGSDTVSTLGFEHALGDYIVSIDLNIDDIKFLPTMLEQIIQGVEIVFAKNEQKQRQTFLYQLISNFFNKLYRWFTSIDLTKDSPNYRIFSRSVVNYILKHDHPEIIQRNIAITGGFKQANLVYKYLQKIEIPKKTLKDSIERGTKLLISTTIIPMRIVTLISLFGAISNIIYSFYIVIIWLVKDIIATGWVTLSLQQSGMFFLFSLVFLIMGEYIIHIITLTEKKPLYNIAYEFTSTKMTREKKLNIEIINEINYV